jgi:hypothetical protein
MRAHGLSAAFYLYKKYSQNIDDVRKRLVFTTHTPEEAGNEKHDIHLCHKMSYFCGLTIEEVKNSPGILMKCSTIPWQPCDLRDWLMESPNYTAKYRGPCGVSMTIFVTLSPLPMHKTGDTGQMKNYTGPGIKTMMRL